MIKRRRKKRNGKSIEVWLLSFVSIVMLISIFIAFMFDDGPRKVTGTDQDGNNGTEAGIKSRDIESAPAPVNSNSADRSTGLETDNIFFPVCIILNGDLSGQSLEREAIQTEVETLLGPAGIKFQISEQMELDQSIEIRIRTFGSSFFVSIRFIRWIDYNANGKNHTIPVPVYSIDSLGTKGTGSRQLTDSVGENMAKFLTEFLQVNKK